jgi:lipopolysaccharide export system permease protein
VLTKIDRYIIRKLLTSYVFATILFLAVAIVIDFSEKLEDFLENDPPVKEIVLDYYLNFIPYIGALLSPLFIFIGVIWFTSKMAFHSEIISIMSSGASFNRFLRPYIFCGLLLSGGLFYANHWLVPHANRAKLDFEIEYIRHKRYASDKIHKRIDKNTFISMRQFVYQRNKGKKFALEKFEETNGIRHLAYKLTADEIVWNPEKETWKLRNYRLWEIDGIHETFTKDRELDTNFPFKPAEFEVKQYLKETMDREEIRDFIKTETQKGSQNLEFFKVEAERRTSSAISVFILTLIGASIGSRKIRGGTGLHLAFGVALSALYIVFLQFSSTFSTNANLPALIAVNIPNVVFGAFALFLIRITPK